MLTPARIWAWALDAATATPRIAATANFFIMLRFLLHRNPVQNPCQLPGPPCQGAGRVVGRGVVGVIGLGHPANGNTGAANEAFITPGTRPSVPAALASGGSRIRALGSKSCGSH